MKCGWKESILSSTTYRRRRSLAYNSPSRVIASRCCSFTLTILFVSLLFPLFFTSLPGKLFPPSSFCCQRLYNTTGWLLVRFWRLHVLIRNQCTMTSNLNEVHRNMVISLVSRYVMHSKSDYICLNDGFFVWIFFNFRVESIHSTLSFPIDYILVRLLLYCSIERRSWTRTRLSERVNAPSCLMIWCIAIRGTNMTMVPNANQSVNRYKCVPSRTSSGSSESNCYLLLMTITEHRMDWCGCIDGRMTS